MLIGHTLALTAHPSDYIEQIASADLFRFHAQVVVGPLCREAEAIQAEHLH